MLQYLLTVSCQWDYDAAVSEALEQCLANEQSLWFSGDWSLPPSHPRSHPVRSPLKLPVRSVGSHRAATPGEQRQFTPCCLVALSPVFVARLMLLEGSITAAVSGQHYSSIIAAQPSRRDL